MKKLIVTSEELRLLKGALTTTIDALETDQHKHKHRNNLEELKELRLLRNKVFKPQMGR